MTKAMPLVLWGHLLPSFGDPGQLTQGFAFKASGMSPSHTSNSAVALPLKHMKPAMMALTMRGES